MKKLLLFVLTVCFFFTASAGKGGCCKKVVQIHDTIQVQVHDTIKTLVYVHDTIFLKDTVVVGPVSAPAQVWDELTTAPLSGATVVAKDGTLTIETVTTNSLGAYSFSTLVSGKQYNFRCTKTGYIASTKTASYTGTNSLPGFGLTK